MTIPPMQLVIEALRETVGPSFLIGVAVLVLARFTFRKSSASFAAVVALILAFVVGNLLAPWNPDWLPSTKRIGWLPWLAIVGTLAGLCIRRWPSAGYSLWAMTATLAAIRVLPKEYHTEPIWAVPAFVLLTGAVGFGLMHLSARRPGWLTPFLGGAALMTAGTVIIHAHSKSLLDIATFGGMCLFGIAAVVAFTKGDVGAIFPGVAILLVGILLAAHHETYSKVPMTAFVLPAVAPLLALVGLIHSVDRQRPWLRVALVSIPVLILLAVAIGLAVVNESLATDVEW